MNSSRIFPLAVIVLMVFSIGCAQGGSPVEPVPLDNVTAVSNESHNLWGLYTFVCDKEAGTVEIIPHRDAELHLNALKFLEPVPNLYLRIEPPLQINGNILDLNLSITHPFVGQHQFTGFDVCGIIFSHGSYSGFHDPDIRIAGPGDTRLLNPDGYSRWWNPAEFPHGNTIFSYIDGLLGTPAEYADFNCTINGYKYFADGLEANTPLTELDPSLRGMFSPGQKRTRHYTIDMSDGLVFNYAIDACWKKPVGSPPYFPPDCFPPNANRPEAYNVSITEIYNSLYHDDSSGITGGSMKLRVDVWDHFNGVLNQVWGESYDGLTFVGGAAPISGNSVYSTYELDFHGGNLKHSGIGRALITVQSEVTGYGGNLPDEELCAYFTYPFNILAEPPAHYGWARTWGGVMYDRVYGAECDSEGNLYSTGYFRNQVDFDPSKGEFILDAIERDVFLLKLNPMGDFVWAFSWGSWSTDHGYAIDVDSSDYIYVTGDFGNTVDFDPGPSVAERTADGKDAFLAKYDKDGNFIWVRTWGGTSDDIGQYMWIDNNDKVYVGGYFMNTVDFDPGPGSAEHTSSGFMDAYLTRFDPDGNFHWVRTWGGTGGDTVYGIATDSVGDVYITGYYNDVVDLDPGDGEDLHTSLGSNDMFLLRLNADGEYVGARSWGGFGSDRGFGVSVGPAGNIYVAGTFNNTVDFDPGPEEDIHISIGWSDLSLSKFSPDGDFEWAHTWGSPGGDKINGISIHGANIFITGYFEDTADFDPSEEGVDNHTSNGSDDFFLSKYDSDGNHNWTRTGGGTDYDHSACVATDYHGNLFIGGVFKVSADFDPGPGVDVHHSNGDRDCFVIKMLPNGYW